MAPARAWTQARGGGWRRAEMRSGWGWWGGGGAGGGGGTWVWEGSVSGVGGGGGGGVDEGMQRGVAEGGEDGLDVGLGGADVAAREGIGSGEGGFFSGGCGHFGL